MGKALVISSHPSIAATNTSADTLGGARRANTTDGSGTRITARIAGTFSLLAVLADNVGTGRAVRFRKNGANGNGLVSPTDTTAGLYADGVNSDTIANGDTFNVRFGSTGSPTYYSIRTVFVATTGHACYYSSFNNAGAENPTGASRFTALAGSNQFQSTNANVRVLVRTAGTLSNAQLNVTTNSQATTSHAYIEVNGSRSAIDISIGAGITGLLEDTSHTATLANGDLVCWEVDPGDAASNTLNINRLTTAITAASGNANDIFATNSGGATRTASATADYYFISGYLLTNSNTEANAKVQHGFRVATKNFRLFVSANTYSAAGTATLRKNGGAATQTFSIGAGLTGTFEDTTHIDTFEATDDAAVEIVGGTSGSITLRWSGLTEYEPVARTVSPGLATEADSALASGLAKAKAIGLSTETDSALAASRLKAKAIGLSAEADAALTVAGARVYAVGLAPETDAAFAFGRAKVMGVGLGAETDTALGVGRKKLLVAGLAIESDIALPIGIRGRFPIGQGEETDTALPITVHLNHYVMAGLALEADSALPMTIRRVRGSTFTGGSRRNTQQGVTRVGTQAPYIIRR